MKKKAKSRSSATKRVKSKTRSSPRKRVSKKSSSSSSKRSTKNSASSKRSKKKTPSKRSAKSSPPAWLEALRLTDPQRDWLSSVTAKTPQAELPELIETLPDEELPRLLEILDAQPSPPAGDDDAEKYNRHRERVAKRERKRSTSGRDIGNIPPVTDQARKDDCRRDLRRYLESYHPQSFPLAWSDDHLRLITKIQTAVLIGGRQALAMPRGSGKTTICTLAAMWAINYGHHRYVMLLQANADKAADILSTVQLEYETNPLLAEDFPEICHPIAALERIAQRARGQTHHGDPTHIVWAGEKLVFPTIPGSESSGAVLCVAGLQEAVRGALFFHPALQQRIRPSLAIVDDPQTRMSAKSEEECNTREQIIRADLIGMAGPGKPFAALMPCTVIQPGDVASRSSTARETRNGVANVARCSMRSPTTWIVGMNTTESGGSP
jgi:hypothetical protein